MYPKNAGTPPRISIGPVLLIADGTVQTADVLVKVTPEGGAAGASGGTISYVEGIVHYAPTQAETNYTAFTITAYKASCIPTSVTVVTTASSTAGYALVPDTQKVDVNTIKTKAITCGAAITVGAYVGSTAAASIHTAANVYTAFGDGANLSKCATATGFATPTNITSASGITLDSTQGATTFASLTCTGLFTVSDGVSISSGTTARPGMSITSATGVGVDINGKSYGIDVSASDGDGIRSVGSQYDINSDIQGVVSGNSTHTAANVYTAFGTGGNLSTCATATGFATETKQDISDSNVVLVLEDTGTTLPAAIAALDAGAGTGARTVTLTVNDGSDALESASVRVTKGAATYVQTTDTSGKVTFNLDNGTYTVAVSLIGYTYSGTTIVVDGDETATYSMTAISITGPSAASLCTVQFRVNLSATAVSGAVCKARLLGINQASDGTILSNAESSDTTDSEGVAELELVRKDSVVKGSGIYKIWIEIGGRPTASIETAIPSQSTI